MEEDDTEEAITYHLAYAHTSRMQSKIWPLCTGSSPKLNTQGWVSGISFDTSVATIEWEKRKNAPDRTAIRVPCICGGVPFMERTSPCGPCALRDAYRRQLLPCDTTAPKQPLFNIAASRARTNLQRRIKAVSLRGSEQSIIGFHGFRRGRARD